MQGILNFFYSIFGYCLEFLYKLFQNTPAPYIFALVVFTLVTRFLLLPTSIPQQKNQAKQFRIQPKMKKLQEKFGNDRQRLSEEQQKLYQREGFNPMAAGCGPMLISLPLLWGVYGAITRPISCVLGFKDAFTKFSENGTIKKIIEGLGTGKRSSYYTELNILNQLKIKSSEISKYAPKFFSDNQISAMKNFSETFVLFGIDLTQTPSIKSFNALWIIPILSGLTSFATSFLSMRMQKKYNPTAQQSALSNGCMMALMPLFSVYICFTVPAGVGFYWVISNVFSLIQTAILSNVYAPPKVAAKNMITDTINRFAYEKNVKLRKNAD